MTVKRAHLFFIPLFFTLLTSCVYQPQLADIPLIEEKGELQIAASMSSTFSSQITVSYGLTESIAIQGNLFNQVIISPSSGHLALGKYGKTNFSWNYELYLGYGIGKNTASSSRGPGSLSAVYESYFTQINFGSINRPSTNFEFGFGLKTGFIHFTLDDNAFYEYNSHMEYDEQGLIIEPQAFIGFGWERFKFRLKTGTATYHSINNSAPYLPIIHWDFGLGGTFLF